VEFICVLNNLFHVSPQFAVSPVAIVLCLRSLRMTREDRKTRVCVFKCMYIRTYVCMYYVCMYVRTYVCTYVCVYVCMYVGVYVTYVCMYVCVCIMYVRR
jgi:hypothetical protein